MIVRYLGGRKFEIEHRQHRVLTDQPLEHHGEDTALTPTELMMGALAACAALYASSVASRHGLGREDLTVEAQWHLAPDASRVDTIALLLVFARPVPPEIVQAVHRAAEQCTLHGTLRTPPEITIEVAMRSGTPGG